MPSSGTSSAPTPAPPPSRTWNDASRDPASRPATGSSGGKNYGTTRAASTRTPRSIASRPRAATSPWSPSSSDIPARSNIPDFLEIAKRYAEEDPNQETYDESGGQRRTS